MSQQGNYPKTLKLNATCLKTFFVEEQDTYLRYFKEYFNYGPRRDDQGKGLDGKKIRRGDSGAYFEVYSKLANEKKFDANDIAAINCLSINLYGGHVVSSLKHLEKDFKKLIADISSRDETIWDVDEKVFAKGEPLWKLYDELCKLDGIATVTASKLLASKRPNLVPIQDKYVCGLFGLDIEKKSEDSWRDSWWVPWWETMQCEDLRNWLSGIQKYAKEPKPSLLRVADVILWKHAQVTNGKK